MKHVVLASYANGNPRPENFAAPEAFSAAFSDNSFVGKLLVKVSEAEA